MRSLIPSWYQSLGVIVALGIVSLLTACTTTSAHTALPSPTAPFTQVQVTQIPIPSTIPSPTDLTFGPDGNLWFTTAAPVPQSNGGPIDAGGVMEDSIVRVTPSGVFTRFPLPTTDVFPMGITAGPDGNIWFTEFYGNAVGRITLSGSVAEFPIPPRPSRTTNSQPARIVAGPDGNLWFGDMGDNAIGRIGPSGQLVEFPLPTHRENPIGSSPYGITVGPDGNLWFTEGAGMRIGRITPSGRITEFKLPGINHVPTEITAGHDGNIWFLEQDKDLIGRITPSGAITEYPLPTAQSYASALVAGADSDIWFTEPRWNKLGRITPTGIITEYPLPKVTGGGPVALALGPDGTLWYTTDNGIDRFRLS